MTEPILLSREQAAELLGVSLRTFQRHIQPELREIEVRIGRCPKYQRVRSLTRARTHWLGQVRDALRGCGVDVPLDVIARRTSAEIMRAHAWASLGESAEQLPSWLRPFLTLAPACERRGQLSLVIDPRRNP